jgi:hypothetical protein
MFAVGAGWELARFALLFYVLYALPEGGQERFAETAIWFGSAQLAIAAAMLYGAIKPNGLGHAAFNFVRIGKGLSVVAGSAAFLSRVFTAVTSATVSTRLEWLQQERAGLLVLALDFIMILFLLSYRPTDNGGRSPHDTRPDYEITDLKEE